MTETLRYRGTLALRSHGDADDVLFLDGDLDERYQYEPLARVISDDLDEHGRYASVRYWTAGAPMGDDKLAERAVRTMLGEASAQFSVCYSEVTGYLWTDEEINVGGHDLLAELGAQAGRYCLLEITYSREPGPP